MGMDVEQGMERGAGHGDGHGHGGKPDHAARSAARGDRTRVKSLGQAFAWCDDLLDELEDERLEWFGDTVLKALASHHMFHHMPPHTNEKKNLLQHQLHRTL